MPLLSEVHFSRGHQYSQGSYLHCNWLLAVWYSCFNLNPRQSLWRWLTWNRSSKVLFPLGMRECCNSTRSVSVEQKICRWATTFPPTPQMSLFRMRLVTDASPLMLLLWIWKQHPWRLFLLKKRNERCHNLQCNLELSGSCMTLKRCLFHNFLNIVE